MTEFWGRTQLCIEFREDIMDIAIGQTLQAVVNIHTDGYGPAKLRDSIWVRIWRPNSNSIRKWRADSKILKWPHMPCAVIPQTMLTLSLSLFLSLSLSVSTAISRWTWVIRCLLKQRMMDVVLTTGAINHAKLQSNHHQQTNTQFFYRPDALPVAQPTVSKHWREKYHSMDLLTPSSPGGLPTLSLTTNSSWLPWGRVSMPLISALMPVPHCSTKTSTFAPFVVEIYVYKSILRVVVLVV